MLPRKQILIQPDNILSSGSCIRQHKKITHVNLPLNHEKGESFFLEILISNHPELIRPSLWSNPRISLEFMEVNEEIVDWSEAGKNPKMSENFVQKNIEKHPELHSFFCKVYHDLAPWQISEIEKQSSIPRQQRKKLSNSKIREKWAEQHIEELDWFTLSSNPHVSQEFFEKHIEKVVWSEICRNRGLHPAFFDKYIKKVDWTSLCQNPSIPEFFFRNHIDEVDFEAICLNDGIEEQFYVDHQYSIPKKGWMWLSRHPRLKEKFFRDNIYKVDWFQLSSNPSPSPSFFLENLDKVIPEEFCKNTFDYYFARKGVTFEKRFRTRDGTSK
jgi:hypothetical protein